MRVTHFKDHFICICSYTERKIPKDAGFRFGTTPYSQIVKYWYTEKPEQASRLKEYCDTEALNAINRSLLSNVAWTGSLLVPKALSLFPFQERAIRFALERNRSYLGLDPGLGKTICAAVIGATSKLSVAYVCPPFLVETVRDEFTKWASHIFLEVYPDSKLEKMRRFLPLMSQKGYVLIVDEAHRFKSDTAQRTKVLFKEYVPRFERVVFMSGTPMPNRPIELFPVLSHAAPECIEFQNKFEYGRKYCAAYKSAWGWDFSGASNMKELQERVVNKFMIRMKKADVLPELPPKTESMVVIGEKLPPALAKLDSAVLREFSPHDLMSGIAPNGHIATYRKELGILKVDKAVEFIQSILEETEESILVFAIHKTVVSQLDIELGKYHPLVVTGDTAMDERKKLVDQFQNDGASRVFIGNIQAAGTGFTLTKATRVVFVEFSWTPADNEQASDRAHRVGQKDNVLVHYLVYKNSVDRAVLETIFQKQRVTRHI